MENQVTVSYLTKMPVLVIEKILSHISNLLNVSLTCKILYEIVCGMENYRRVMYIEGTVSYGATRLAVDDDAMFASIMNTFRSINEIELSGCFAFLQLNERLTAIMTKFGANITTLELDGFALTIDTIHKLLQQTPKLESLTFSNGSAMWIDMVETTLQLPNLKTLEFRNFIGLSTIGNFIPAGSLIHFRSFRYQSSEMIQNILKKQHNIKHLTLYCNFDRTIISVNHLQLETLILGSLVCYTNDELVQILKCQTNLKELRFAMYRFSMSIFESICNYLKKLEVLEVCLQDPELPRSNCNVFAMLTELKKLRHFCTSNASNFVGNRFQCDSLERLEIGNSHCCGERLSGVVHSIVQSFTNLTHLKMRFDDFAALSFVLSRCTALISISSRIENPSAYEFTQKRFPNVQHLILTTKGWNAIKRREISQSISALVHAVPNLKSLSMPSSNPTFNVDLMKDFMNGCKSLVYFSVNCFELEPSFCTDDFLEIIQRLSDYLRGFQLSFKAQGLLNSHVIKEILSNEFIDQYGVINANGSSRFCLYKRER